MSITIHSQTNNPYSKETKGSYIRLITSEKHHGHCSADRTYTHCRPSRHTICCPASGANTSRRSVCRFRAHGAGENDAVDRRLVRLVLLYSTRRNAGGGHSGWTVTFETTSLTRRTRSRCVRRGPGRGSPCTVSGVIAVCILLSPSTLHDEEPHTSSSHHRRSSGVLTDDSLTTKYLM